jgi:hypothetical protein
VPVRFGGEQVEYGIEDVFFRVGGWRAGVSVEETIVGMGGVDVGGVPYFTSSRDYAG